MRGRSQPGGGGERNTPRASARWTGAGQTGDQKCGCHPAGFESGGRKEQVWGTGETRGHASTSPRGPSGPTAAGAKQAPSQPGAAPRGRGAAGARGQASHPPWVRTGVLRGDALPLDTRLLFPWLGEASEHGRFSRWFCRSPPFPGARCGGESPKVDPAPESQQCGGRTKDTPLDPFLVLPPPAGRRPKAPEPWRLRASYCPRRNAWLAELILDLRVLLAQGLGQQLGQSQTA